MKKLLLILTVLISSITLAQDCGRFTNWVSTYDGAKNKSTNLSEDIAFVKSTKKDGEVIYCIRVRFVSKKYIDTESQLTIFLDDATVINKPEAANSVDLKGSLYVYESTAMLTKSEVNSILENKIYITMLYTHDVYIDTKTADKLKKDLKCLTY